MKALEDRIQFYRQDMFNRFEQEVKPFTSNMQNDFAYDRWYTELSDIRKYFLNIIHKYHPSWEAPYIIGGHRIDHHIYGYIAPMKLLRRGYQGIIRTPAEQLAFLSKQFHEHGIRFIYVALPCKKAVYPEIILPLDFISRHSNIIPQWRYMLYDLLIHNVEVVDLYPYFVRYRENNKLFSYGHDISCIGSILIGNILGSYLLDTTENLTESDPLKHNFQTRDCTVKEDGMEYQTEQICIGISGGVTPYQGTEIKSEIGIFGNCNLQKYRGYGFDITSHLSNVLGYPVNYLGRLLPFASSGLNEIADVPDGTFAGKKIVIYLGFPSASFVRSSQVDGSWNTKEIPERCFHI